MLVHSDITMRFINEGNIEEGQASFYHYWLKYPNPHLLYSGNAHFSGYISTQEAGMLRNKRLIT